jgi:raffinose/stachyose/melibiose transport system substrate-binding protein
VAQLQHRRRRQDLWAKIANDFHTLHPTVTIEVVPIETNDLQRNRLPAALLTNDPPDVFQAWGGGEMVEQVAAGYLKDITDLVQPEVASIGAAAKIWSVDGKQYGLPYNFGVEGFWYNKDIFKQAGIAAPPATYDEPKADITKLKTVTGVAPIAVGAGDSWPAAHWWYNFALHECSASAVQAASTGQVRRPVLHQGWRRPQGLPRPEGVPGRIPRHPGPDRRRQLRGHGRQRQGRHGAHGSLEQWRHPGAHRRQEGPGLPRLVPLPEHGRHAYPQHRDGWRRRLRGLQERAAGGRGVPQVPRQPGQPEGLRRHRAGIPVVKGAEAGLTDPNLQAISKATQSATAVNLWLDTQLGAKAGTPMNTAIVAIFAGTGTSQGVVDALKKATAQ